MRLKFRGIIQPRKSDLFFLFGIWPGIKLVALPYLTHVQKDKQMILPFVSGQNRRLVVSIIFHNAAYSYSVRMLVLNLTIERNKLDTS